jgi:ribosomal protein S3AE
MAVLKKHWVPVLAPTLFKNEQLGESYVLETDSLTGRGISVNLMNLTGDMKKQNLTVAFKIINVKEGKAHTRTIGIDMQQGSVKRLVRRGRNKIDDSFLITLKGGQIARIKPLVITKSLTNNSKATALRHATRETLKAVCAEINFETLVSDVVNNKLQRYMRSTLDHIYPVRSVDIRSCKLMPRFALTEEQPVEESTYKIEQVVEEDGERS